VEGGTEQAEGHRENQGKGFDKINGIYRIIGGELYSLQTFLPAASEMPGVLIK
jgi:hypothetical protein